MAASATQRRRWRFLSGVALGCVAHRALAKPGRQRLAVLAAAAVLGFAAGEFA